MMQLSDDVYIKCNNCNHVNLVETDSLECNTSSYERSMGAEIQYDFYGEINCEKCNSWIEININGCEYPVGAFNYSSCDCSGGEFVSEPSVEMDYEFDDDYNDYAYKEYIEANTLLENYREQIINLSARDFEFFVGDIFKDLGFDIRVTKPTRDGGCDIIATKAEPIPFTLIVECKHWGMDHKVDVSVVRSVYGVQTANQVNKSVIVTSSKFTRDARKFADERQHMMTLWDIDDLLRLVVK